MKKCIILFFFSSLHPPFLCHSLWEGSIYYINGKKRRGELGWRKRVVIESKKATGSFTCQVKNVG